MENTSKSLHPMLMVAAGSVTVASLAAAAHFTGLLPTQATHTEPTVVAAAPTQAPQPSAPAALPTAPAPAAAVAAAPAVPATPVATQPAPASRAASRPHAQTQHRSSEPVQQARRSGDDWRYDGGTQRVSDNQAGIDVIPSRPAPAVATSAPPVCRECGTVESVQEVAAKGEGSGVGAIAGGVLGGVLGHQVERNVRTDKQYKVTVRFDDGTVQTYTQTNNAWHTGERVRLSDGSLLPI